MKSFKVSKTKIPSVYGHLWIFAFKFPNEEIIALTNKLKPKDPVNLRLHSACLTSELFGSLKCDCKSQLEKFLNFFHNKKDNYLLIYFPSHEGRGIGFFNKLKVYEAQRKYNLDTYQANRYFGFPDDLRDFNHAIDILNYFQIKHIILYTNNPLKIEFFKKLKKYGINFQRREFLTPPISSFCLNYLLTKQEKGHHLIEKKKLMVYFKKLNDKENTIL